MSDFNVQGLGSPIRPSDAHEHGTLSFGRRKGKAFCQPPFALHRQQFENYEQNVDVCPPGKISADAHGDSVSHLIHRVFR